MKELAIERMLGQNESAFRNDMRGRCGMDWPDYLAMSEADKDAFGLRLAKGGYESGFGPTMQSVAMARRWGETRRAFSFDPDLLASLLEADTSNLSAGALASMPYGSMYLALPPQVIQRISIAGPLFGVDAIGDIEMRAVGILFDLSRGETYASGASEPRTYLGVMPICEIGSSVRGGRRVETLDCSAVRVPLEDVGRFDALVMRVIESMVLTAGDFAELFSTLPDHRLAHQEVTPAATDYVTVALNALAYLCDPRVRPDRTIAPDAPRRRVKHHTTAATVCEVGTRVGAALRMQRSDCARAQRAWDEAHAATVDDAVRRASPRPHIRRAHWHGYWTGPREAPTGLAVHWIAPTPVGFEMSDRVAAATLQHVLPPREGATAYDG